jgi:hypothetical protein
MPRPYIKPRGLVRKEIRERRETSLERKQEKEAQKCPKR